MSLIDTARDALKDLPISDIVRERLSLALDRLTDAEAKIDTLQIEKGSLQAQLKEVQIHREQAEREVQRLKNESVEEIRIIHGTEFLRGKRTGGKWLPFCPKCHLPLSRELRRGSLFCSDDYKCGWFCPETCHSVESWIAELPK